MGRPKGSRNKKDKFDSLDKDFQDKMAASTPEEIRGVIAQVALNQEELQKAKENDEDLANLKEQVALASEDYSSGTKMNRLRIQFAKRCLEDKGKEAGDSGLAEKQHSNIARA